MTTSLRPKIVLLGDSITERGFVFSMRGWGLQLASWFGVKADIINRGHSGYNTRVAMELLDKRKEGWYHASMNEIPAQLVILFWGANDAALNGIQGISVDEYKERLQTQIQNIRKSGENYAKNNNENSNFKSNIILVTPPPVYDDDWRIEVQNKFKQTNPKVSDEELNNIILDRNNKTTEIYANCVIDIGKESNCPVIDLYHKMQNNIPKDNDSYKVYLSDGLHLSPQGNDFLYKEIKTVIRKELPQLKPSNISKDFLEWRDAIAESNKKL